MLAQALQLLGALLILLAYAGTMFKRITQDTYIYQALNLIGSLILAYLAMSTFQWGFVLLETVWSGISIYAIARKLVKPSAA